MPQIGGVWLSDPVYEIVERIKGQNNQAIQVVCAELIREGAERWERRERRRRQTEAKSDTQPAAA